MRPKTTSGSCMLAAPRFVLAVAAVLVLLVTLSSPAWAQTDDSKPEELGKQRTALYLKATRTPLADLGSDVNQIAVRSEACRIKYGSTVCGLSDKALESDKLEDRYAYYVKQPVEAHAKGHAVKIDRHNWAGSGTPNPHP